MSAEVRWLATSIGCFPLCAAHARSCIVFVELAGFRLFSFLFLFSRHGSHRGPPEHRKSVGEVRAGCAKHGTSTGVRWSRTKYKLISHRSKQVLAEQCAPAQPKLQVG